MAEHLVDDGGVVEQVDMMRSAELAPESVGACNTQSHASQLAARRGGAGRGDGGIETTSPKTGRGRRSIDVDPVTVSHLRRRRKQQIADQLEAGPAWTETDLVVTRTDGARLDPDVVSQKLNRIVKEAGLRRIRFHDLRHTQATLGLKLGEPTYIVSRRLGHVSEAFIQMR